MENITNRERAAICLHVYGNENNRMTLYQIADDKKRDKPLKPDSLRTTANVWFNSHRIQTAVKYYQERKKDFETEVIKKYLLENQPGESEEPNKPNEPAPGDAVNFLDPEAFLAFANQKANEIIDEKERRAYLEMIAKLMNYKDKEEGETEVLRAYLPLQCYSCELKKRCERCNFNKCPIEL